MHAVNVRHVRFDLAMLKVPKRLTLHLARMSFYLSSKRKISLAIATLLHAIKTIITKTKFGVKYTVLRVKATPMGFEPTRAEHIGLAVQRLNLSATASLATGRIIPVFEL